MILSYGTLSDDYDLSEKAYHCHVGKSQRHNREEANVHD